MFDLRAYGRVVSAVLASVVLAPVACSTSGEPRDAGADAARDASQDATDASGTDASGGDASAEAGVPCDVVAPTECPKRAPSYADVAPIFAERCVGCHNGSGGMWPLSSYQHVADWYGEIRGEMLSCGMPPVASGLEMPTEERLLILTWIRCGFPR